MVEPRGHDRVEPGGPVAGRPDNAVALAQQEEAVLEVTAGSSPAATISPENTVAPPSRPSLWKSKVARIWAVIVAVVTVITSVVSIWPIIFKDESSAQSLKVIMKPFRSDTVSHFALPVGSPIETFPSGGRLCSAEQEQWLQQHGVRFQRDYLVEVRNSAGGGGSLAVGNFHGVADSSTPAGAAYIVECDKFGDGGVVAEPARLLLDSGEGAFFDKSLLGPAGTGQPNSPLAYNLRPGETGQIVLTLSALSDFDGEVRVSVAAGDDTSEVTAATAQKEPLHVPGVLSPRTILVKVEDGVLRCHVTPNPSAQTTACDAQDLFQGKKS
jgi:hypothetical protein